MDKQGERPNPWIGRELFDAYAQKIGTITGLAFPRKRLGTSWLLVETAGGARVPVPIVGIQTRGDRLVLPYPKSYVESGPTLAPDQPPSQAELRRLGLQYGFDDRVPGITSCCRDCGLCQRHRRERS
jgi:hypothetical protein